MQQLIEFKKAMDAIDPAAFHIALAVLAMALVFVFRKAAPALWKRVPDRIKPLPPILFAAVLGASTSADAWAALIEALRSTLIAGPAAIGYFRFFKETTTKAQPKRVEGETIVPEAGDQ